MIPIYHGIPVGLFLSGWHILQHSLAINGPTVIGTHHARVFVLPHLAVNPAMGEGGPAMWACVGHAGHTAILVTEEHHVLAEDLHTQRFVFAQVFGQCYTIPRVCG